MSERQRARLERQAIGQIADRIEHGRYAALRAAALCRARWARVAYTFEPSFSSGSFLPAPGVVSEARDGLIVLP